MKVTCMQNRRVLCALAAVWLAAATSSSAHAQAAPVMPSSTPRVERPLLNQLGFAPHWNKTALLVVDAHDSAPLVARVVHPDGSTVQLPVGAARFDGSSETWLRSIDLSTQRSPGRYRLAVDLRPPVEFEVGGSVYAPARRALLRAFYLQRCGEALHDKETGLVHGVCHADDGTLAHDDELHIKAMRWPNRGGWHDAGDYGKYVATTAVAIGRVLAAYERSPLRWASDDTGIPESGNRIPDLLDEMRVGLDWMLAMQRADGAVYRKVGGLEWPKQKEPHQDTAPRYVYGVSTPETAKAAAAWAQAARLVRPYDAKAAARYLAAARRGWDWLERRRDSAQRIDVLPGDNSGSGPYVSNHIDTEPSLLYDWDDRMWAAVELYLSTRELAYLQWLQARLRDAPFNLFEWKDPSAMAMSYLHWHPGFAGHRALAALVRERIVQRARHVLAGMSGSVWRIANQRFVWGSNKMTAEEGVALCLAHELTGEPAYLQAARDQLHYLLGRNAFGKSFVSGVGHDAVSQVSHLWFQVIKRPIPGLFVGGPNSSEQSDIAPRGRGPLSWVDDTRSYATNEFAVDYNASLIGLLDALESDCYARLRQ
jgi:endoglucanase